MNTADSYLVNYPSNMKTQVSASGRALRETPTAPRGRGSGRGGGVEERLFRSGAGTGWRDGRPRCAGPEGGLRVPPDTGAAWAAAQQCLTVPAGCLHASSANSRTTTRESFKKYNRHAKREKTKSNGQLKPERAGEQDTRSSEQKAVATVTGTDPTVATSTCVTGLNTATKSLAVRS